MGKKQTDCSVLGSAEEEKKVRNTISSRTALGYESDDDSAVWQYDAVSWENVQNPFYRKVAACMVCMRCLPEDRADATFVKVSLRWLQWWSLVADLSAATVAIITFNDVTYCCNEPILNFGSLSLPWKHLIRALTYCYLLLILAEIYPVVRNGFPFNIVNPVFGFVITLAMFFDDSKAEALLMWCIETFAVLCEYGIYCFKAHQRDWLNREVDRLAILTIPKKNRRMSNETIGEADEDEQLRHRQDFFRLKLEQKFHKKMLWYLRFGCYINIVFVLSLLGLIILVSRAGGLCINGNKIPNLLDPDQLGRCTACFEENGFCEVCSDSVRMCYYPYS